MLILHQQPNLGLEQNLRKRHFVFRFGLDETSKTLGMSFRFSSIVLDIAYVDKLAALAKKLLKT